jgi:hypothetical protein
MEDDYIADSKTGREELIGCTYESRGVSGPMKHDPICGAHETRGVLAKTRKRLDGKNELNARRADAFHQIGRDANRNSADFGRRLARLVHVRGVEIEAPTLSSVLADEVLQLAAAVAAHQ